jgi:hypothetical protein
MADREKALTAFSGIVGESLNARIPLAVFRRIGIVENNELPKVGEGGQVLEQQVLHVRVAELLFVSRKRTER